MPRKRSTPWIHQWSRFIIGAIATVGLILTTYLTITKLAGGEVVCSAADFAAGASGCTSVLDSPYAIVFGLPLSLFGALAYLSMGTAALIPYAINADKNVKFRKSLETWTWLFLLIGATSMAVFSSYLMYLLAVKLQTTCYYCIGSALFSYSLLGLTLFGHDWEDVGQLVLMGAIAALVTIIATLGIYAPINNPTTVNGQEILPNITESPEPGRGWEITTTSSAAEIALAKHLTEVGVVMYGTYWCPFCHQQKLLFGKEAAAELTYVECAEDALRHPPEPAKCDAAGVDSYPAWAIGGQLLKGRVSLEQLAAASGYEGPQDFKYRVP
ncbi:MAG: vitamin K epoxide reductase family protein [Spirulina sp. DLM2.Bin59]|nr:MAG: vitamin K epoxide reductase family protein [Spirulina sp. DLM2.Bin59]